MTNKEIAKEIVDRWFGDINSENSLFLFNPKARLKDLITKALDDKLNDEPKGFVTIFLNGQWGCCYTDINGDHLIKKFNRKEQADNLCKSLHKLVNIND